jgi:ubiquinone/menaquinone biosynthesis C-methylase UbiE
MNYYDKIAKSYEELYKEEQEKKLAIIKKYFEASKDDKLLDVGCGTGISTEAFDCNKTGIDPSKKLIEIAKKKAAKVKGNKTRYVVGSAEKLPFKDHSFDIVISITAIQNFDDIEKGLREIKRVGKDRFVLTFLKKSQKQKKIRQLIHSLFKVMKEIDEDKDAILLCS